MKQSKIKNLRRSLLCSLGVLSLAAIGCGGGGGGTAISTPTTLTIGNGAVAASLGKTSKSISKALGVIPSGTNVNIKAFTISGVLISEQVGVELPYSYPVNSDLKSALIGASAVFNVSDGVNIEYKSIVKIPASQIGTGAIQDANGADLTETVDVTSSAITQLVAIEMGKSVNRSIDLGTVSDDATKLALKALVNEAKPIMDPATLSDSFKSSANTSDSMIAAIVNSLSTNGTQTLSGIKSFFSAPPTIAKTLVSRTKSFSNASARLSGAQKGASDNASLSSLLSKKLAALVISPEATIERATAGAKMLVSVVDMASKASGAGQTTLNAELNTVFVGLDNIDLLNVVTIATNTILPVINSNVATLEDAGAIGDVASFFGGALQFDDVATQDVSASFSNVLKSVKKPTSFLADSLKVAADTTNGASNIIAQATNANLGSSLDFNAAVIQAVKDTNSDLLVTITNVVKDLAPTSKATLFNGDSTVDANSFVSGLSDDLPRSTLSDLFLVPSFLTRNLFPDGARIRRNFDFFGNLTGTNYSLSNDSRQNAADNEYTYTWRLGNLVDGTATQTSAGITFKLTNVAGNYTVELEQKKGSVITTATAYVSVIAAPVPYVYIQDSNLDIVQGKTVSTFVEVSRDDLTFSLYNDTRTFTVEVEPITGFTFSTLTVSSGFGFSFNRNPFRITVAENVVPKAYAVKILVKSGTDIVVTKVITVTVKGLSDTKLFVAGVSEKKATESITLKGIATQEKSVSASAELTMTVTSATKTWSTTAKMSVGQSSVETTLASLTAGKYEVKFDSFDGSVRKTQTSTFYVTEVGAPIFTKVEVAGVNVLKSPIVNLVGSSTSVNVSLLLTAGVVGSEVNVAYTLDGTTITMPHTISNVTGTNQYTVVATEASGNKTATIEFFVNYTQSKKLVVKSVMLAGTGLSNADTLTTTMTAGVYVINASSVTGLTLNTSNDSDTLYFDIMTDNATTSGVAGTGYNVEVTLTDPASSRTASLKVVNAEIISSSNGYDITTASSLDFSGTKASGSSALISVPVDTVITHFNMLFVPVTDGIRLNLIALRSSMEQILTGNAFASSLRNLNGTDLEITVKLTRDNFSIVDFTSNKTIQSFKVEKIKVN